MAANEKTGTEIMKEKFEDKELGTEQLENVSGGSDSEVQLDSFFLNYMFGNEVCQRWKNEDTEYGVDNGDHKAYEQVKNGWAKVGVRFEADVNRDWNRPAKHFIGEIPISRQQAFEHAQRILGRFVKDSDWKPWRK